MGSFSVVGRRDHHEGALQRCSAQAAGSSIQLPSHKAGQVMKGRNIDEWSACRTHWSWLVLVCFCLFWLWVCNWFLLSLTRSLNTTFRAFAPNALNVAFGPFGLGTFCPPRVSYTHDVAMHASRVTMQMCPHVGIIRRVIWIFFEM